MQNIVKLANMEKIYLLAFPLSYFKYVWSKFCFDDIDMRFFIPTWNSSKKPSDMFVEHG